MKTPAGYFHRFYVFAFCLLICIHVSSSQTVSLVGKIVDAATHQPIRDVSVVVLELGQRKNTTDSGRFCFEHLAPGRYTVSACHLAYAGVERSLHCTEKQSDTVVIEMEPALLQSDEVIVRSTRTSPTVQGIPYPFDVATSDQILQYSSVTISDALRESPGISVVRDGTWETDVSIRGMTGSNIVTMIDNTRIETATDIAGTLSLFDLHDLERAEIVESPGSVLYGTGAFGGVLHLMTKRNSFTDQLHMDGEVTNDLSSVDGKVGEHAAFETSSDALAMRLSGGYRNAGNTMTPLGEIPNSQYHDFNINGSLDLKTFDNQSAFFFYQRSQAEDTGIPGGAPFTASATVRYTLARRELFGLEYTIPNPRPDLPLITLRFSHQDIDRNVEVIQNPALTLTPHATHSTTNGQIEAKIILSSEQVLTVGSDVWQRDLDSRRERINTSTDQIIGDRPVPYSHFFSGGVYGQDEWHLLPDQLTATLGARYDWIRVSSDETLSPEYVVTSGVLQSVPPGQQILWNKTSASDGSWSANGGLSYALAPYLDVTSLVATAFRSPSLEERFEYINLGNIVRVGNPYLRSEKSVSANAGFRIHTDYTHLKSDIFFNNLTDLVAYVPGTFEGESAFIEQNIGEARLYGYEVSVEQTLAVWSILKCQAAYIRGEDTFDHSNLPQIAPLNGRIELRTLLEAIGTVDIAATFAAEQKNLAADEIRTPGYAIVDVDIVSIPLTIEQFSLTVHSGIQNIFNKLYQNHLSTLRGFITFEPGRNFFLSTTIAV
ncbi:MAG: TonB-dependent receptor [Bacteroidota bacterium]